jgi:hypothetical protein
MVRPGTNPVNPLYDSAFCPRTSRCQGTVDAHNLRAEPHAEVPIGGGTRYVLCRSGIVDLRSLGQGPEGDSKRAITVTHTHEEVAVFDISANEIEIG